ncbi:unnamed protein product [Bursaphelenchus xylophilus]|uniref:(pine wood nematode) hypothetical protein n=1 Tax=Bursaphelenchus xylophilus TaxID=6326 RepID=A0A1I7S1C6_BURXY|nr:unnamed protein product [Bursaphelenchus xylophilus]CAG9080278.1 unnamed protein product [Bursaphelenchus xylophilus]
MLNRRHHVPTRRFCRFPVDKTKPVPPKQTVDPNQYDMKPKVKTAHNFAEEPKIFFKSSVPSSTKSRHSRPRTSRPKPDSSKVFRLCGPSNYRFPDCFKCGEALSTLIGYPCGHPFCAKCCGLDLHVPIEKQDHQQVLCDCPCCQQFFRCFVGLANQKFVYNINAIVESEMKVASKLMEQREAERQVEEMQRQLEDLQTHWDCQICFDAQCDTAFSCGHRACGNCALKLTSCHYCRQKITQRIKIYR